MEKTLMNSVVYLSDAASQLPGRCTLSNKRTVLGREKRATGIPIEKPFVKGGEPVGSFQVRCLS